MYFSLSINLKFIATKNKKKANKDQNLSDYDTSEEEELIISPTDELFILAKSVIISIDDEDGDQINRSIIQFVVWDILDNTTFIHRDIQIWSPHSDSSVTVTSVVWVSLNEIGQLRSTRNKAAKRDVRSFIATGTLDGMILLWSTDCMDQVYPSRIMGFDVYPQFDIFK